MMSHCHGTRHVWINKIDKQHFMHEEVWLYGPPVVYCIFLLALLAIETQPRDHFLNKHVIHDF